MQNVRILAFIILAVLGALGALGQRAGRKAVYAPKPSYPQVLRSNRIGGIVKLEVVVSPAGSVQKVSVKGGNPILAEAAASAVKLWKYSPADQTTTEEVDVKFTPTEEAAALTDRNQY